MARSIHFEPHLSTDELAARYRIAKDSVERSHWHFLWLLARGFTAKAIASITRYSAYWIGQIARRYNAHGPDGIKDQRHRARRGRQLLTAAQRDELRAALSGPTPQHDRWNGRTVAAWLAQHLGRPICRQLGWIYLRRLGARLYMPRPRHVHADLQAQDDFKARLRPLLREMATALPHATVELWESGGHGRTSYWAQTDPAQGVVFGRQTPARAGPASVCVALPRRLCASRLSLRSHRLSPGPSANVRQLAPL
jgi:transposase